jgi:hypothetical protein
VFFGVRSRIFVVLHVLIVLALHLPMIEIVLYNSVMFISGSLAGCTSPAALSPVAGCPRVAWIIRAQSVAGLAVICPNALAVAPVLEFLRACRGSFWYRVRAVTLPSGARAWVVRVGVRSDFVAGGGSVPGVLRLAALRLSSAVLEGAA